MFKKLDFSQKQINKYYRAAKKDLKIAINSNISEVSFRFCYDALLKLAIAVCAKHGLRVKSKRGHHIALIKKLSSYLNDSEIKLLANEMRSKRNHSLYSGGITISKKEVKEYTKWTKDIFKRANENFFNKQQKLKL